MRSYRTTDLLALILLLSGAVAVPLAGWLAGVVLLWASPSWTRRAKLLGTAVVPGGLAAPLLFLAVPTGGSRCERFATTDGTVLSETCRAADGFRLPVWLALTVFAVLAVAPMATTVVLFARLRAAASVGSGSGSGGGAPRLSADVS